MSKIRKQAERVLTSTALHRAVYLVSVDTSPMDADLLDKVPEIIRQRFEGTAIHVVEVFPVQR